MSEVHAFWVALIPLATLLALAVLAGTRMHAKSIPHLIVHEPISEIDLARNGVEWGLPVENTAQGDARDCELYLEASWQADGTPVALPRRPMWWGRGGSSETIRGRAERIVQLFRVYLETGLNPYVGLTFASMERAELRRFGLSQTDDVVLLFSLSSRETIAKYVAVRTQWQELVDNLLEEPGTKGHPIRIVYDGRTRPTFEDVVAQPTATLPS